MKKIQIPILPMHEKFIQPEYAHEGDAGMDLHNTEAFSLQPGEYKKIQCGFSIAIPSGYFGAIAPRSGLALQTGVTVLNTWGVIDSSYRGEIAVILINLGKEERSFPVQSRIAQLIILPFQQAVFFFTEKKLEESDRGVDGFGSTGIHIRRKHD
jgi:dUTP pyrophosphatase